MNRTVKAIYKTGSFILKEPYDAPENAEVELTVHGPLLIAPKIADPNARARALRAITERMRTNPLPHEAIRFSRDELHERR